MKIKKLCPKCKREKEMVSIWGALFNEDYYDFKEQLKSEEYNLYLKELPEIQNNIDVIQEKINKIEDKIKAVYPREYYELKALSQELVFNINRMNYANTKLTSGLNR